MRTFEQAKDFAVFQHRRPNRNWLNLCQMFSRQCVGADSFGPSARVAFNSIPAADRHATFPPPAGSIAYYGHPRSGFGHAVFVVEGGFVWSNDILRRGRIDRVRWNVFPARWGLPYRGWIDACPSGALPLAGGGGRGPVGVRFRQGKKVFRARMRFGQADSDSVWNLQVALQARGFGIPAGPTGYYGRQTLAACAAFQRRQGWTGRNADGIAGPETARRLGLRWVP